MKVDFFWRAESNRHHPHDKPARSDRVDVPDDDARTIAALMRHYPGPLGSHRSGCFEVQTDDGVWSRDDQMRIDVSTPARAAKVRFKTWDELDAEWEDAA